MKIGILTLPILGNYGGILQAYALQLVLKRMGHYVETIDIDIARAERVSYWKIPFAWGKRIYRKCKGEKCIVFYEWKRAKENTCIGTYTREFILRHIVLTKKRYSSKISFRDIKKKKYDAIIVGSDQVWRVSYAHPDISIYFLNFLHNKEIRRISYAASFGVSESEFSEKQRRECGRLIEKFDAVSVREDSALDLISKIYQWNCNPIQVLDPALLLSQTDYLELITESKDCNEGVFYYILDMTTDKQLMIDKVSQYVKMDSFTVYPKSVSCYDDVSLRIVPPVEEWIQAFKNASYIVTDSFHGCVFSIIFNKPFIVYGNIDRGITRVESLLTIFGLKDRFIFSSEDINQKFVQTGINYLEVNGILDIWRKKSLSFLVNSLV